MRLIFLAMLMTTTVGCVSRSPVYEVQVINQTSVSLSAGMVQRVPPGDMPRADWAGPEHIAMTQNVVMQKHWGTLLEPDKMVILGPTDGPPPGDAILRVYASNGTVENLTGYTHGDPARVDEAIYPGRNSFNVIYVHGHLAVERIDWQPVKSEKH